MNKQTTPKKNAEAENSGVRQMMGMKGAALETDKFKIRVQLCKPVTWIPLIWGALQGRHGIAGGCGRVHEAGAAGCPG